MSNVLKMVAKQAVIGLLEKGWSHRKISRELEINRETVSRYDRIRQEEKSKPAISPTGSETEINPKPAIPPAGKKSSGRPSECEKHAENIKRKLERGLSAQRIWQDLRYEEGISFGYDSVKRYIKRLEIREETAFRRMEVMPGKEVQVDFGSGGRIRDGEHNRKSHVFRAILSYSRKGYSEAVYKQDTESFLRCLENAFWDWGGVPETIVLDNLKAAVSQADWYEPELNPKITAFARHYNVVFLPTKPYMPRHKGKVESGIKYVKNNGIKGKKFKSLTEENEHLKKWESQIADKRIHGTTKEQVFKVYTEAERKALQALPEERFPFFQETQRSVHRDAHIEVEKAYYSVPPEYVGHKVWVRWDSRLIRVFNHNHDQIAVHAKVSQGKFNTDKRHIASSKISAVEMGAEYLIEKICRTGFEAGQWAKAMIKERGIEGIRVLQGLLYLSKKYPYVLLNRACHFALESNCYRLKAVKNWLKKNENQEEFGFMKTHPLIRPLSEYQNILYVSFKPDKEEQCNEIATDKLS